MTGNKRMKLGVISDTHGKLNGKIRDIFQGVDAIIHCGDIGSKGILVELENIAPTYAVLGNTDKPFIYPGLKYRYTVSINDFNILIKHEFDPEFDNHRKSAKDFDMVFFGHTHIPYIKKQNGVLFVNPGSASQGRRGNPESVVLIELNEKNIQPKIIKFT